MLVLELEYQELEYDNENDLSSLCLDVFFHREFLTSRSCFQVGNSVCTSVSGSCRLMACGSRRSS